MQSNGAHRERRHVAINTSHSSLLKTARIQIKTGMYFRRYAEDVFESRTTPGQGTSHCAEGGRIGMRECSASGLIHIPQAVQNGMSQGRREDDD